MMRHGWIAIDGVQTGDRTLHEQTAALRRAIAECAGRTVIEFGCAEGLIAREFIRAGAKSAQCFEVSADHLAVAHEQCAGLPMEFILCDLNLEASQLVVRADIVLCLGIAHKLLDPGAGIRLAADSSLDLVLIRSGRREVDGIITSKHRGGKCDSHATMRERGFVLERVEIGPEPHSERVEYWRRMK
jgi:predicted RNA methylase